MAKDLNNIKGSFKCIKCADICESYHSCPKPAIDCVGPFCKTKCKNYYSKGFVSFGNFVDVCNYYKSILDSNYDIDFSQELQSIVEKFNEVLIKKGEDCAE